ncbi:hypothetical protein QBC46DRAFT_458297 [Diplogelasinospora grovesii]|uniref:DUF4185 domain-containing protein n=1 Tax=Diplogelasinospora grovesii TaxID=303347 RepID=A0AAN6N924_9PEZI|nr:hypothetical protein QBC46DRAFT_458297 [Diplogelasinospora grovesii]
MRRLLQKVLDKSQKAPTQDAPGSTASEITPQVMDGVGTGSEAVDNTQAVGTNPIKISSVQRLGFQNASNSCSHRDLGFTGKIAGKWYAVFGDTLWCAPGVKDPAQDLPGFHGMVRDSVSLLTNDPLTVVDLNLNNDSPVKHQLQFVPFNPAWGETNMYGFGGTSLCETDARSGTGAVYYLVNANDAGLIGAGVAKVVVKSGTPTVTQRYDGTKGHWWDAKTTARYGDVAAYRDERSEYIYLLGHPPSTITGWLAASYVYMARVRATDAFDLTKYQYWWGRQQGWKTKVLNVFTPETAVMWGTGQGQISWNAYYGCYVFVHLAIGGGTVHLRTAPAPAGPWSGDVQVYTAAPIDGGLVYAGVAHPYLDASGKTLVVSFTNNNHIEVIKVAFTK